MELKQINSLVMLADTGSFKAAADKLYISPSQITKIIKSLEEELGCELFKRKRSGIVLTETGEKIYKNGVRILKEFDEIGMISNGDSRKSLSVLSSYNVNIGACFSEFIKNEGENGDFYNFYESSVYPKLSDLKSGRFEIGFTFAEKNQRVSLDLKLKEKQLEFVSLKKLQASIYMRKKHPFCKLSVAGYEDMMRMKFVQLRGGFFIPRFNSGYSSSKKAIFDYAKVGMVTNSLSSAFDVVRNTDMVYVGCDLFGIHKKDTDLTVVPIEEATGAVEFGFIKRVGKELSKHCKSFVDYVVSKL